MQYATLHDISLHNQLKWWKVLNQKKKVLDILHSGELMNDVWRLSPAPDLISLHFDADVTAVESMTQMGLIEQGTEERTNTTHIGISIITMAFYSYQYLPSSVTRRLLFFLL